MPRSISKGIERMSQGNKRNRSPIMNRPAHFQIDRKKYGVKKRIYG